MKIGIEIVTIVFTWSLVILATTTIILGALVLLKKLIDFFLGL